MTFPGGSPAPRILVEARGWGGRWTVLSHSARARTADDGSYTMDLPPEQSYMIGVTDDEWAARSLAGIVVREGVPRVGLDLTLERGECDPRSGDLPEGPTRSRHPVGP